MKVLIVGDVVGKSGLKKLGEIVPEYIINNNIDFCIVNGENSANGKGLRNKEYEEILNYGANCITMGNHLYYRKEMATEYKNLPHLIIPANVTNIDGNRYYIEEKNGIKYGVINLIGRAEMGPLFENNNKNPFHVADEIISKLNEVGVDYIFVDFHAEASAEKIAMGHYLNGRVSCVFGTHTHVQTADEIIFESGTAYITDIGMTGPKDSVIGLKKEVALERFVEEKYAKYLCSENEGILNGIEIEFDDSKKVAICIKRVQVD